MKGMKGLWRNWILLIFSIFIFAGFSHAATIKVVPSSDSVKPGESLWFDIVVSSIPHEGLSAVQFRLNMEAGEANVSGLSDLTQGEPSHVVVGSPLLTADVLSSTSHIGSYFTAGAGSNGVLVMDNETVKNGSALYTFAHTNGATLPNGTGGSVAHFKVAVGNDVVADNILVTLSDVALLNGENKFTISSNEGALIPLNINLAPQDVSNMTATDKVGDESGTIQLSWTPSPSSDATGYKIYQLYAASENLLQTINNPAATGTELSGLESGVAYSFKVKAFSTSGESTGVIANVTPVDDVKPVISIAGVEEGKYYTSQLTPSISITDANLSAQTITLNGAAYDRSPITGEGSYTLTASASDQWGNQSSSAVSFVIDKTPPSVTFSGVTSGSYYNSSLSIAVSAQDTNIDSILVKLDGSTVLTTGGVVPVSSEGSHTLSVEAVDKAGLGTTDSVSFTIDTTAPERAAIAAGLDGSYLDADRALISGTAEAGSRVTVVLGSMVYTAAVGQDGVFTVEGIILAEGSNTLSVKVTDRAGNESSEATLNIVKDTIAPVVAVTGVENSGYYNTDVAPSVSVTDANLSGTTITLNGQPYTEGSVISEDGSYTFSVKGTDHAGHETVQTMTFVIDKTAPSITLTGIEDGSHYNTDLTPAVSVTDSNFSGSTIALNGQTYVEGAVISNEGDYVLLVTATDLAGNERTSTVGFTIDKTNPEIAVTGVNDGIYYTSDVTPNVSVSDAHLSAQMVTLNGEVYTGGTVINVEGEYTLSASASDLAGNEVTSTVVFTIDKTAPVITLTGVEEDSYYNIDVAANITVMDINLESSSSTLNGSSYQSGDIISAEG
ncbi:MAG: Ig-like domain-containing protein, partial [Deltaproteobacteria bacterium]|nr:Ig-like domain-containing protein [Deltaproteobacteria bacterium]